MRGIFWLAAKPVSFSRRTLLHGVSKLVSNISHWKHNGDASPENLNNLFMNLLLMRPLNLLFIRLWNCCFTLLLLIEIWTICLIKLLQIRFLNYLVYKLLLICYLNCLLCKPFNCLFMKLCLIRPSDSLVTKSTILNCLITLLLILSLSSFVNLFLASL